MNILNTAIVAFILGIANHSDLDLKASNYIDLYKELAIIEMYRSGVPASITLAQALHESNYGDSDLALRANNHFGIKCKSYWEGLTYYHKDDDFNDQGNLIESCFRAYDNVYDSYIDHSNFLSLTRHYEPLFQLSKYDYKAWANGLQKSGYATDPKYADKLIRIIEKYKLSVLDRAENPFSKLKPLD